MDSNFKKRLIENTLSCINEMFPCDDTSDKELANKIAKISVVSTVAVLEEYEKLKNEK